MVNPPIYGKLGDGDGNFQEKNTFPAGSWKPPGSATGVLNPEDQ